MRSTLITFLLGALSASTVFLLIFDVNLRSPSPADAQGITSSRVNQDSQSDLPDNSNGEPRVVASEGERSGGQDALSASAQVPDDFFEAIPTPPEFDLFPDDGIYWRDSWKGLHANLERERLDPNWAYGAEADISAALQRQPDFVGHGTPVVNCRSKTCEIQLLAYGASDIDVPEWHTILGSAYRDIRDEFDIATISVGEQGGITAIVWHLKKKELPDADTAR